MSRVVIDTSALLAVLLGEPERLALIAVTDGFELVAPASLPWEVGNALIAAFRKKRLSIADIGLAWESYQAVSIRLAEVDIAAALRTAAGMGIYAYDAYVLEVARSEKLPLLTLDQRLVRAAAHMKLPVMEIPQ